MTWAAWIAIAALTCWHPPVVDAQSNYSRPTRADGARTVEAVRTLEPIVVDGRLDDPAWSTAAPLTHFVQRDPEEGASPTERTVVYVLYDDQALYVGARLYDSAPDSIVARLGRRDARLESDRFIVFLDPYLDRRSGYYFGINAAGTLYDGVLMNDDWDDDEWDAVWDGKAVIDEEGWSVEMRIPYSQLRFHHAEAHVWGVNFRREISRKNENVFLVYSPRSESGFVSRFWDLVGIRDVRSRRQIEIIPYATSRARHDEQAAGNPFSDGMRYSIDAGVDLRVGITPNLTVNATANPDFGQVEVDPAVINLSDFETFYPEKRPFFVEGASTFGSFGYGGANSNWGFNWGNPMFFYSRRIGRAPQGSLPAHDHARVPDGTRILTAGKLTGRMAGNWNVGLIQAVTAREHADLSVAGSTIGSEVEPATYHGVLRAQKEFSEGAHGLGIITTAVNRFFADEGLADQINDRALVFGADGWTFLESSKTWVVNGWAGVSHVTATQARMLNLQRSSMHYFQRPDTRAIRLDSSATSMTGWAGRFALNKQSGRVAFNAALGAVSPSFDVNDAGFQWRTEVVNGHVAGGYRWPDPGSWTRSASLTAAAFRSVDFDGHTIWTGVFGLAGIQFLNYYEVNARMAYNPETVNNQRTRGGPRTLNPPGYEVGINVRSDQRKNLVVGLNGDTYQSEGMRYGSIGTNVEWKPAANVSIMVSPSARWNLENAQWVGAYADPLATATYGQRYVFAELDQFTLSSSVRANWTFTPKLSLQLYAQPLFSKGAYRRYKELVRAGSYDFRVFGEGASTFDPGTGTVDPDGDGPAPAIRLPELDFSVVSLRGTAVLRWEYSPGSTLYLVWTQRRSDFSRDDELDFGSSFSRLGQAPMENVFVLKLTYWLSR